VKLVFAAEPLLDASPQSVIPAKADPFIGVRALQNWVPAFAGMTDEERMTEFS
jgi:hypothetical protein